MIFAEVSLAVCCAFLAAKLHLLISKDTGSLGDSLSDAAKLLLPSFILLAIWAAGYEDDQAVDIVHKADIALQGVFAGKVAVYFCRTGLVFDILRVVAQFSRATGSPDC
jgi:hypothetical protein